MTHDSSQAFPVVPQLRVRLLQRAALRHHRRQENAMSLLATYGFIVLAFAGGFLTCAILCFGKREDDGDA